MNLRDRILARAALEELVAARDLTGLAAALNAEGYKARQQRFISARAVLTQCQSGAQILTALEQADQAGNVLARWALKFLGQDAGLDIGDPGIEPLLTKLQADGVLQAGWSQELLNLALRPVAVDRLEVEAAMFNPDGTLK